MISDVLSIVAVLAVAGFISAVAGWKPGTPQPIDGLVAAMNCGVCVPPGRDRCGDCGCVEDCGNWFCRFAPPLTGLTREEDAWLDEGKVS